jgi:arylsulfatase
MDVGVDLAAPVTEDYAADDNAFTGTIKSVTIEVGQDDVSYKLDPELVFNGLMAGQ